jgi:hypothetical protein
MGQHHASFDSGDLPFSYVGEEAGRTVITPGANLLSVGSRRDAEKWPARDRRRDPDKLDRITHGRFNPFTAGRIRRGLALLRRLAAETPPEKEMVPYGGALLRRLMLKGAVRLYEQALEEYLGERLASRLEPLYPGGRRAELARALAGEASENSARGAGQGEWWDLAGLIAPASQVEALEAELEAGRIGSLSELAARFARLQGDFPEWEWSWCRVLLEERLGVAPERASPGQLAELLEGWKAAAVKSCRLALADAGKEIDERARIAFGADGGPAEREADFTAVRGRPEDHPTVRQLEEEIVRIEARAGRLLDWLRGLA